LQYEVSGPRRIDLRKTSDIFTSVHFAPNRHSSYETDQSGAVSCNLSACWWRLPTFTNRTAMCKSRIRLSICVSRAVPAAMICHAPFMQNLVFFCRLLHSIVPRRVDVESEPDDGCRLVQAFLILGESRARTSGFFQSA
jgi:hypothetical protein